jgi:SAM-dependent MidA family methyltransferase
VSEEPLLERIRTGIAETGPLSFDRFMDLALYAPGGFYDRPPVGTDGHFITGPHVHPVFGSLVANAIREGWSELGRPAPLQVVEVAAGDGTLAGSMLPALEGIDVTYRAVERTDGAIRALAERGLEATTDLGATLGGSFTGMIVANELLDNLPFRMVRRDGGGEHRELLVDHDTSGLRFVEAPCPPDLVELTPPIAPGEEAPVPTGALRFVERLASSLERAFVLLVDYGWDATPGAPADPATGAWQDRPTAPDDDDDDHAPTPTVHAYRHHRATADVLTDPGSRDITAGVDLSLLRRHAAELGLLAPASVTQRSALLSLGFRRWDAEERRLQATLMSEGQGAAAARTWSERSRASALVDRSSLGALRWLLLITPGVEEPDWLHTARAMDATDAQA